MGSGLYQSLDSSGVILTDSSGLLAAVQGEFQDALGADLVVDPASPAGVLIAAEVAARQTVAGTNAALANQINPALAGGVFLDALCALSGLARQAATNSVIANASLTGVPGTLVPAGSLARTAAGDQFATAAAVTLGSDGKATVNLIAVATGPVPAPPGSLSIVSAVLGWETASNATAATLGQGMPSDAALRTLRGQTLALQGAALPEAITSALYAVPGVTSLQFLENTSGSPATLDGILLAGHSVWACVAGGTDLAVATALFQNKSLGCGWNGATSVAVTEPRSGRVYPVRFDRPTLVPIQVTVTVRANPATLDPQASVLAAILGSADGSLTGWVAQAEDNLPGLRVGGNVSPYEIAGAITAAFPTIHIVNIQIGTIASGSLSAGELVIATNALATLTSGSITVVSA